MPTLTTRCTYPACDNRPEAAMTRGGRNEAVCRAHARLACEAMLTGSTITAVRTLTAAEATNIRRTWGAVR